MNLEHPKILFFGAGVIGGSVGAWIAQRYEEVCLLDQGAVAEAMKARGITVYPGDNPAKRETIPVRVVDRLEDAPKDVDVVAIAVKNYSLDAVARRVKDVLGDRPVVIGIQNGIENQRVLPKYFSKVAYCVVSYNAWMDEPAVIGYQKKGPLHLGTLDGGLKTELAAIARVFNRGVETEITDRIQDAIHCKIVINLTNSLTTLIGFGVKEIADRAAFQELLSGLLWEGVTILKAAGFRESKLGGMPGWSLLWASTHLPRLVTRPLFEKNVRKMVLSSMAQDVIRRGQKDTELESINGYILELADRHGLRVPVNRAVYALSKREFAKDRFKPLDIREVREAVHAGA